MDIKAQIELIARQAQEAARFLATASAADKNAVLSAMAEQLVSATPDILAANEVDVSAAAAAGKNSAFIDRLRLSADRVTAMADDLRQIVRLHDPVGEFLKTWQQPNGLLISKIRVPLGVVGIIYESRPNVTSDCAGLCLKSGNAVILRGGKESVQTNKMIFVALRQAVQAKGFPAGCIGYVDTPDRQAVSCLLRMNEYIDLIIPRGGESLIRAVTEESRIPVIKHYRGICHTYIDESADLSMAADIAFNAKVQRPSTCNAMECLLVHEKLADALLPGLLRRLQAAGVEIRGCERTRRIGTDIRPATEEDFGTEYLDLILSVKVVSGIDQACEHIARYGSKHSEAIVTANMERSAQFLRRVDAACVYVNASTRFTDGNQFGLGAEMGISTDKLHARGPMGLEELTTYKYIVMGNGQIRE